VGLTSTEQASYTARTQDLPPVHIIFGRSAEMQGVHQKIEKFAGTSVPLVIQGESGSGKGVLARYIHSRSQVATGSFVNVNCAAIPGTLIESELFGYEEGAFTGARASKPGRAEMANGGTLFLDGIDEIELSLQAKLLQLLQDSQFDRIGGGEAIRIQTRLICATTRPLEGEMAAGRFRTDVYYRINVGRVSLPPLRSRAEDIVHLAAYFLERHRKQHSSTVQPISSALVRMLKNHPWPGNIRQLENLMERYVILGSEEAVSAELLNWERAHVIPEFPAEGVVDLKKVTRQAIQELERKVILTALEANRWNRKRAADQLKISYRALLYKIRQAGVPPRRRFPDSVEPANTAISAD
jgi:two-component system, NtrC family, response regulator AtoC